MKNRDVIVKAGSRVLKSTPRKLNLAADLVRNKKVSFANIQLRFCEKKSC
ncbi:50S ribosomal protein L22 [Wolbachia endosymbiont of Cylisticus convexus]|nr:50S ribosomal protein L22 [Wolbachia endosymbiont of Cylisticus convexus]